MSEAEILFEVKDGLGLITLNRPKALNALTHGMILAMEKVMPGWEKDSASRPWWCGAPATAPFAPAAT